MTNYDLFLSTDSPPKLCSWIPTRAAGLARLQEFTPRAGHAYTRTRNSDLGPDNRTNISALSPYLARRMITEAEVVEAVVSAHGFGAAEKFIQEVFWRTYWKGWLELRPDVLVQFNKERLALKEKLITDNKMRVRFETAAQGRTGIECFDAWVAELHTYGWLHNHARMWFASIWIFTLGLPWQLGADFFYKHLLDADAASNTLSWRWVGGLQTKGKHYLARASNIAQHTNGRFSPAFKLNESGLALQESYLVPGPSALPPSGIAKTERVGLLIGADDLHPQSLIFGAKVIGAAIFELPHVNDVNSPAGQFATGALADATARVQSDFGVDVTSCKAAASVVEWAQKLDVSEVVMAYAPTGLNAWALRDVKQSLAQKGISLVQVRRDWDSKTWPLATGGFFKLKEKLPSLIEKLIK